MLPAAGFTVRSAQGHGRGDPVPGPARRRDRLLRQLHRQHLDAPDEAQGLRRTAPTTLDEIEPVPPRAVRRASAWARWASRTPTPWPCAATRPSGTASARWPTSRPTPRAGRSPATSSSSAGPNGPRSARPTGWSSGQTRPMDPTLMYEAVSQGSVDVVSAYTSDGRITAYDLVILEDPRRAFPPTTPCCWSRRRPPRGPTSSRRCGPWSAPSRWRRCARPTGGSTSNTRRSAAPRKSCWNRVDRPAAAQLPPFEPSPPGFRPRPSPPAPRS